MIDKMYATVIFTCMKNTQERAKLFTYEIHHNIQIYRYIHNFKVQLFQLNVFIVFSAILIGPLVKLNGFYTSIKTCAYEYLISALISEC